MLCPSRDCCIHQFRLIEESSDNAANLRQRKSHSQTFNVDFGSASNSHRISLLHANRKYLGNMEDIEKYSEIFN